MFLSLMLTTLKSSTICQSVSHLNLIFIMFPLAHVQQIWHLKAVITYENTQPDISNLRLMRKSHQFLTYPTRLDLSTKQPTIIVSTLQTERVVLQLGQTQFHPAINSIIRLVFHVCTIICWWDQWDINSHKKLGGRDNPILILVLEF